MDTNNVREMGDDGADWASNLPGVDNLPPSRPSNRNAKPGAKKASDGPKKIAKINASMPTLDDDRWPKNLHAEQVVLGNIMSIEDMTGKSREGAELALARLQKSLFECKENQWIAQCICNLRDSGKRVNMVTVFALASDMNWLGRIGGEAYIGTVASCPPTHDIMDHMASLTACDRLRQKITFHYEAIKESYELAANDTWNDENDPDASNYVEAIGKDRPELHEMMSRHVSKLSDISSGVGEAKGERASKIGSRFLSALDARQVAAVEGKEPEGTRTGMADLDKVIGILRPGLSVVAAWSGVGKSSLARKWAMNIASRDVRRRGVILFLAEMTRDETFDAMVASVAEVDSSKLDRGEPYTQAEMDRIVTAAAFVSALPIHFEDASSMEKLNPSNLEAICRRVGREFKADGIELAAVFADYLQLFEPDTSVRNREQDMSKLAYALHSIGQRLGVPVVSLSQINEAGKERKDGRPCAEDLRESRGITQAAVSVILIHNPNYMSRRRVVAGTSAQVMEGVEIIVDKGRKGPVGIVEAFFLPFCAAFKDKSELAKDEGAAPEVLFSDDDYTTGGLFGEDVPFDA